MSDPVEVPKEEPAAAASAVSSPMQSTISSHSSPHATRLSSKKKKAEEAETNASKEQAAKEEGNHSSNGKANGKSNDAMEVDDPPENGVDDDVEKMETEDTSAGKSGKGTKRTYLQLVTDSLVALNAVNKGSSLPAIKKWLLDEHTQLEDSKHFRQQINQAIKTGVSQGRFEKVKGSYKLASSWKAKQRKKRKPSHSQQAVASSKSKAKAGSSEPATLSHKELVKVHKEKLKQLEKTLTPEEFEKTKQSMRKKEEALKRKEEAEIKERDRLDRLRRRRFPIEDTKLHAEDKELGVKAPPDLKPRPYLPYFWNVTLPLDDSRRQGKTSDHILRYSKSDGLDHGSRGLVSDLLQVYHFFRGDVHFGGGEMSVLPGRQNASTTKRKKRAPGDKPAEAPPLVPEFSLPHLIHAVDEILNGNARRFKLIPPLISHLFVTSLQLLCRSQDAPVGKDPQRHLQFELNKYLLPALTPGSWPDIVHLYMDAQERFYSTDSSRDPNVLEGLNTDLLYLFGVAETPTIPMTPAAMLKKKKTETDAAQHPLPEGYGAYLGDRRSVLFRAHEKLGRFEAWSLSAEEIMALLRALTDDVLASFPGISENLAHREEEMYALLKAKKAADSKFRKVKLAFEGPKKPKKAPPGSKGGENAEGANGTTEPFKPTATKKEFESAARAQQRANDAYEKGIRCLVARTEPVGVDRNFCPVYCFRHDPEVLYVEELRPPANPPSNIPEEFLYQRRSWHIVESTSLFDSFVASLDVRGKREANLYETLLGPAGSHQHSMRRHLFDDVKLAAESNSRLRQKEAILQRLEAAKMRCDEEKGRRSGRKKADQADELEKARKELERFEKKNREPVKQEIDSSVEDRTGLTTLQYFEMGGNNPREPRRLRGKKEPDVPPPIVDHLSCSKLVPSWEDGTSGIVGMIVSQLLTVEEKIDSVSPMRPMEKRKAWIGKLENVVQSWHNLIPIQVDPAENQPSFSTTTTTSDTVGTPVAKRRRSGGSGDTPSSVSSAPGSQSLSSIIGSLKQPLLDLEERVADITNITDEARDAEIADDNISVDETGEAELALAWKKELHRLSRTSYRQHLTVREHLVRAISLARKAHASDVLSELRAALLLFHPNAASDCRKAALKVLEAHGGYSGSDSDLEDSDEEEGDDQKTESDEIVSVLSAEAALLTGCLGGSDDATRGDWIELVQSCRTLSRLSSLTAAFAEDVTTKLERIMDERDDLVDAVAMWQKEAAKASKGKGERMKRKESEEPTEVWADVNCTDEFVMAQVENYPWWPAKICEVKDEELRESLSTVGRVLVALVGEMGQGLRVVSKDRIRPFTGEPIADLNLEASKKIRNELEESLAMARRIRRGTAKAKPQS